MKYTTVKDRNLTCGSLKLLHRFYLLEVAKKLEKGTMLLSTLVMEHPSARRQAATNRGTYLSAYSAPLNKET